MGWKTGVNPCGLIFTFPLTDLIRPYSLFLWLIAGFDICRQQHPSRALVVVA